MSRGGRFGSVPSAGPWGMALVVFFAAIGLLLIGAATDEIVLVVMGGILVVAAGLWGMFYGEKAASELSQGPEPGGDRRGRGGSK